MNGPGIYFINSRARSAFGALPGRSPRMPAQEAAVGRRRQRRGFIGPPASMIGELRWRHRLSRRSFSEIAVGGSAQGRRRCQRSRRRLLPRMATAHRRELTAGGPIRTPTIPFRIGRQSAGTLFGQKKSSRDINSADNILKSPSAPACIRSTRMNANGHGAFGQTACEASWRNICQ